MRLVATKPLVAWLPLLAVGLVALRGGVVWADEDPEVQYVWTRTIGGSSEDHANDVAVDDDSNVFIAGWFTGAVDFDPTGGVDTHASQGREDVFVAKLGGDGTFAWARTFGGAKSDIAYRLVVDSAGDVIVVGWFRGTVDFDPTEGVDEHTAAGGYEDVFVTKLHADGSYAWTRTFGAAGSDRAQGVAVDSADNVLVTGAFWYTVDFDPGEGINPHTSLGGYDVFVSKLTASGQHVWTATVGGTTYDMGFAVAVDGGDHVLVTGVYTLTVDFDPGPGRDWHYNGGAFISKLQSNGTHIWTRTFGSNTSQTEGVLGADIAVDGQDNVLTAGYHVGSIDLDPTAGEDWHNQTGYSADAFVSKLHADGSYAWGYTAGASSYDGAMGVAASPNGDVLLTGHFQSKVDFHPDPVLKDERLAKGWRDIFLTRLGADGGYLWTKTVGSTGAEEGGYAVALNPIGDVFLVGRFTQTVDFDPGAGVDEHQSNGIFDLFVSRFDAVSPFHDCNDNGVRDEEDIASGTSQDCNGNAVPDECDIDNGTSEDCNENAVPDECDVASGASSDCNVNQTPDECDIAGGTSEDANGNGIPDECEGPGDLNCDGSIDGCDIAPFVLALIDPAEYGLQYPLCDIAFADLNGDELIDEADVAPFVDVLVNGP